MHLLEQRTPIQRRAGRAQALLIAGPTASGKSALALRLAERSGGLVVNADAMQVYADLAVLTARPNATAMARAPHALYGSVDGGDPYSVSRWLADVAALLAEEDRLPIIVGGTGLYLRALVVGLSPIPDVPAAVRAEVRAWAAGRPPAELHAVLAARDPRTAAGLRPSDPQRLIRALEVNAATGGSLAAYQAQRGTPLLDLARCAAVTLITDRSALRERIDARFDAMMREGALVEVERLMRRTLPPDLPVMRALGVPQLARAWRGETSLAEAIAAAKIDTRRYAKRQETFFRHQLPRFVALPPAEAEQALAIAV